eukprot:TRINITY_DN9013_c0_g1_i1.p6 TRINITY_DN9013_c0_g1~~TRINITY_DN9013_c0_g1_i1.p6  ORF type:complete len:116 (-),score=12.94 TRINITY_DN9013_c0_g1_i1:511-858(-)
MELVDFGSLEYKFVLQEKRNLENQLQMVTEELNKQRTEYGNAEMCEQLRAHCERYRSERNQVVNNLQKAEQELDRVSNKHERLIDQVKKTIQRLKLTNPNVVNIQDVRTLFEMTS